jgi:histidinol-phosphate aminotransferase
MNFRDLANPAAATLTPYQPGKPLSELEREYGISGAIKLASNENPLGPSPRALEAVRAALPELALYPDSHGFELKRTLAARLGVDPAQITLGNGSNEVLELIARAYLRPGDEAVVAQYAFAIFAIVAHAAGGRVVEVPAREYGAALDAMRAAVTPRTRLVFLANPNNPTGTVVDGAALREFVASLPEHVLMVLDEAYCEYLAGRAGYPDGVRWLADFPRLIVTRTFSKVYGLAGLRVGYAVSHAELADYLNRVRESFNVNALGLAGAQAALEDREHLERTVALNREGLATLVREAETLGIPYIPSVGNFLTVDVGRPAAPVYEAMLREGVIVRPLGPYGMPNHLRITTGTAEQSARCLAALRQALGR